jgi:hypothetical protein
MKISKRKLKKLIFEIISESKRSSARERLAKMKAARAHKQASIAAAEIEGPIETGFKVTLTNGEKVILPATELGFAKSQFKKASDLYPLVGASYEPGQSKSGLVFDNRIAALKYFSKMTKMQRTQDVASGMDTINKHMSKKRFFGLFEGNTISRKALRQLIKEAFTVGNENSSLSVVEHELINVVGPYISEISYPEVISHMAELLPEMIDHFNRAYAILNMSKNTDILIDNQYFSGNKLKQVIKDTISYYYDEIASSDLKEELERLSYVSKEQGHTYGIEHLPTQYDKKKADDIIGHT